jgi:hypothetical protein
LGSEKRYTRLVVKVERVPVGWYSAGERIVRFGRKCLYNVNVNIVKASKIFPVLLIALLSLAHFSWTSWRSA